MTGKNPYVHLTPETREFVRQLEAEKAPPLYTLSYAEAREVLNKAQSGNTPRPDVMISDIEVPVSKKLKNVVPVRIFRPVGMYEVLPVVFYFHGGGWVMGNRDTHDRLVREIAVGSGAAVIFVEYTPSPEAQYPVPLEQAFAAMKYITENAYNLQLDPCRVAVAGDSVGGNMAAVMTLMCKQQKGPEICCQALMYPVTNASFMTGSYREFSGGPWLTRKAMRWFWDAYLPDKARRKEITASPLLANLSELKGLPPALIITDANDVLRDEGEEYAFKLMQAKVQVTAARYQGTIHDFLMLDALAETNPAKAALAQVNGFLHQMLFP